MKSGLEGLRSRTLMTAAQVERVIARLAHEILEPDDAHEGLFLIGIRRGGEALARRLAAKIEEISGQRPDLGFLNIDLYRDDRIAHGLPESEIPTDLNGKVVVVIDDVLFTGRTVRSALDAVVDLGRPKVIRLAVLIDRGLRELPIQGDYVGRVLPTHPAEHVTVSVGRVYDDADQVSIARASD